MTDKPMTVRYNHRMTVGELRKKLEEFSDDLLVVSAHDSLEVYVEEVERYIDENGILQPYVSLYGRSWVA